MTAVAGSERRIEERVPLTASFFYSPAFEAYKDVRFWGITLNTSPSGLCAYISHPLEDGFCIKVQSKSLWDKPHDARVVWCREMGPSLFKVGLSLTR